jgi:hypothetical protein
MFYLCTFSPGFLTSILTKSLNSDGYSVVHTSTVSYSPKFCTKYDTRVDSLLLASVIFWAAFDIISLSKKWVLGHF